MLLFSKGDNGWHIDIPFTGVVKREKVTAIQFYSYRLQIKGAIDAIHAEDNNNNVSRRIILPSLFASGSRQIFQLYQDIMVIVAYFGKPNLFVTFTCNPK